MVRFLGKSRRREPATEPRSGKRGGLTAVPRWAVITVLAAGTAASLVGVTMASALPGRDARVAARPHPVGPAARPGPAKAMPMHGQGGGRHRQRPLRTSCRSVAHIGDSTSVDLISAAYLPDPRTRLAARYAGVGVRHLRVDASSGRSIVEALPGQVSGYNVARAWRDAGYSGCWVFALGTNDTANVANGSAVGLMTRISELMSVAHGQPVMWVNTRTLVPGGPWSVANEQAWNAALALARYPNMRIFDWAAVAKAGWFLPDGIHYNTLGCAIRARAIADALARAFPADGQSRGRVVR